MDKTERTALFKLLLAYVNLIDNGRVRLDSDNLPEVVEARRILGDTTEIRREIFLEELEELEAKHGFVLQFDDNGNRVVDPR